MNKKYIDLRIKETLNEAERLLELRMKQIKPTRPKSIYMDLKVDEDGRFYFEERMV